jgi:dephospho-CoA kinase/transcription elongation GreA/GreB family factor
MYNELTEQELLLLPVDALTLNERLVELYSRNETLSAVIQEAIEQSSETTHDNAPYDVAKDEKVINDSMIHGLESIRSRSKVFLPDTESEVVGVGKIAILECDGEQKIIEIAGDWHDRHNEDNLVLNRRAPLAELLIGLTQSDDVTLPDGTKWKISQIRTVDIEISTSESQDLSDAELSDWRASRILFVCGHHASGKSSVIKEALEKDYLIFDTGPTLRKVHQQRRADISFEDWVSIGESQNGKNFTDIILKDELEKLIETSEVQRSGIVVIGNRSLSGIEYMRENLHISDSRIMYVVTPKKVMFERFKEREQLPNLPAVEFDDIIEQEMKKGLYHVGRNADYKILNTGSIKEVAKKVKTLLDEWVPEND